MALKQKYYAKSKMKIWTGRIDDPADPDSFRMHQIVKILDLRKIKSEQINNLEIKICLLGFKCDEGVKRNLGRPGAERGPEAIRREFANLPVTFGAGVNIFDAGDILCLDENLEEAQEQLSEAVNLLLENNMFPLVLGGGHETAFGNYNGIVKYLNKKESSQQTPAIINFDAHLDFRPFDKGGTSGTMFYQIAEQCAREKLPFAYFCLGVQTYGNTISLFKRAESYGSQIILAKDVLDSKNSSNIIKLEQYIKEHRHLYVTICSDVFNAANAPGVSSPQPFGLNPEIVLSFVKQIFSSNKVLAFDISEVSPRFDNDNNTAKLAAVVIYAVINILAKKTS